MELGGGLVGLELSGLIDLKLSSSIERSMNRLLQLIATAEGELALHFHDIWTDG